MVVDPFAADIPRTISFMYDMKVHGNHEGATRDGVIIWINIGQAICAIRLQLFNLISLSTPQKQIVVVGPTAMRSLSELLGLMKRHHSRERLGA